MFNGYSWQSRTLEVRPDRLPPDFDAPMSLSASTSNGAFPLGPSPLHAMPYIPPLEEQLIPSPMGSMFNIPRVPSASGRTLFVGNVRTAVAHCVQPRSLIALRFSRQLPFGVQWQELKDLFRQAGLRADSDGRSRDETRRRVRMTAIVRINSLRTELLGGSGEKLQVEHLAHYRYCR